MAGARAPLAPSTRWTVKRGELEPPVTGPITPTTRSCGMNVIWPGVVPRAVTVPGAVSSDPLAIVLGSAAFYVMLVKATMTCALITTGGTR